MITPSSLIPHIPFVLVLVPLFITSVFIFVIILFVLRFVKGGKYAEELKAKIADGSFPKEQFQELEKRITEKGGLQQDLLSANEWYGNIGTITYTLTKSTGSDIYAGPDDQLPSAMTDMRFYLGIGGFGPAALRRLTGITATKMRNDEISITMLEGMFIVKLNGQELGVVDIVGKRILDNNKKQVAELISPSNLYVSELQVLNIGNLKMEVSWKVLFGKGKEAKLLSQKGNMNLFKISSHIPVVQLSPGLSKKERVLIFGVYTFLKVQSLLNPNTYR